MGITKPGGDLSFPTLPAPTSGQKELDRLNGLGTTAPTDTPHAGGTGGPNDNADYLAGKATEKAAKTYAKPDFNADGPQPGPNTQKSATERANDALLAMKTDHANERHVNKLRQAPPALATVEKQGPVKFEPSADAVKASVKKCTTCEHEVGRLACLVDVSKSGDDEAKYIVSQSSGDPTFDAAALDAIKATLPKSATGFSWSRFRFSAEVYHFSKMEMLLDPGFKPPGRRLASKESGASSMTTSVRLVDFR